MNNNLEYLKKLFTEEVGESVDCIEIVEKDGKKRLKIVWPNFHSYTQDMRSVKNKYNVNTAGYVEQKESENKDGHSIVYYAVSED